MALTKSIYPPAVGLALNPMTYVINTDNHKSTAGTNSVDYLLFPTYDSAGDYFTISFLDIDIVLTCAATPDGSGKQYVQGSGFGSITEWLGAVMEDLEANYYISKYYSLSVSVNKIYFTAKEKGDEYDIFISGISGSSVSHTQVTPGVDPVYRDFYKIIGQVFLGDGPEDTLLGEDAITPDDSGNCEFDVSGYILPELAVSFLFPEDTTNLINVQANACRKFLFRYGEVYGETPEVKAMYSDSERYALIAGLSFDKLAEYNEGSTDWYTVWNALGTSRTFLTNQGNKNIFASFLGNYKITDTTAYEKLYFIAPSGATSLKIYIKMYYTDGNESANTLVKTQACTELNVYEIVCSYEALNIDALKASGKTVERYQLWIQNQSAQVSNYFWFILDNKDYVNIRYFIFRNSMGGFDTLRCVGENYSAVEVSRQEAAKILDYDYTTDDRAEDNYRNVEKQSFKTSTGWLNHIFPYENPAESAQYMRDFLLSTEIWELDIDNELKYPVKITSSKIAISQTDENLKALEFEYERAYTDETYTA